MSASEHGLVPPSDSESYTPVSGLAVTALILAGLGAVVLASLWIGARLSGQPAVQPIWLLPPTAALAMALVARWRIRHSEGTQTGDRIASSALWIALLSLLCYGAYLFATELAIRNQAQGYSEAWFTKAGKPPLMAGFLDTLNPAQRANVNPEDEKAIRERFPRETHQYEITELVRFLQRAGDQFEATPRGLKGWEQLQEGGYKVDQVFQIRTPEGQFDVLLPVVGRDLPELGGRQWQVLAGRSEIRGRDTTALGRILLDAQFEGKRALEKWTEHINSKQLFDAFLDTVPLGERAKYEGKKDAPEFQKFLAGDFIRVDGNVPSAEERKKIAENLLQVNALNINPGNNANPVGPPQARFVGDRLFIEHLAEVRQLNGPPLVAHITMEVDGDELNQELRQLRQGNWKDLKLLPPNDRGTQEIDRFPKRAYRVVSVDLRPKDPRLGGGPQPMGQ